MADEDKINFSMFLEEYQNDSRDAFQDIYDALMVFEKNTGMMDQLEIILRKIHTLKSSSKMLEFMEVVNFCHTIEGMVSRFLNGYVPVKQEHINLLFESVDMLETMVKQRCDGYTNGDNYQKVTFSTSRTSGNETQVSNPRSAVNPFPVVERISTVRVNIELLDSLFNLAGELIIVMNRIDNLVSDDSSKELSKTLKSMSRLVKGIHEDVSAARLVPVEEIFQKFPRMMRNLAKEDGKEINFIMEGKDIELDKAILDSLSEPLIHILRNAIDHGIESPDERTKRNKSQTGTIKLTVKRTDTNIYICVDDDGSGIDTDLMKGILVKKGLLKQEEVQLMADERIMDYLFQPGYTTSETVTDISGRGVGLNIVRSSIEKMGGTVKISTQPGKGSRFTMKLPLSTSILQTTMVSVGDSVFAIPSNIILETIEIKPQNVKMVGSDIFLILRDEVIPYMHLSRLLNLPYDEEVAELALVLYRGTSFYCIGVDSVLDQLETIVKPFDPIAKRFMGFSGGTILGDGRVVLLLDVMKIIGSQSVREWSLNSEND